MFANSKIVSRCTVLLEDDDCLRAEMLPASITKSNAKHVPAYHGDANGFLHIPVGTNMDDIERMAIHHTLSSVDNNKTEAAKILGFARKTLHNKLDKYDNEAYV